MHTTIPRMRMRIGGAGQTFAKLIRSAPAPPLRARALILVRIGLVDTGRIAATKYAILGQLCALILVGTLGVVATTLPTHCAVAPGRDYAPAAGKCVLCTKRPANAVLTNTIASRFSYLYFPCSLTHSESPPQCTSAHSFTSMIDGDGVWVCANYGGEAASDSRSSGASRC